MDDVCKNMDDVSKDMDDISKDMDDVSRDIDNVNVARTCMMLAQIRTMSTSALLHFCGRWSIFYSRSVVRILNNNVSDFTSFLIVLLFSFLIRHI